jgi:hypothetical protein
MLGSDGAASPQEVLQGQLQQAGLMGGADDTTVVGDPVGAEGEQRQLPDEVEQYLDMVFGEQGSFDPQQEALEAQRQHQLAQFAEMMSAAGMGTSGMERAGAMDIYQQSARDIASAKSDWQQQQIENAASAAGLVMEDEWGALGREQQVAMAQLVSALEQEGAAMSNEHQKEMARLMHDLEEQGMIMSHEQAKEMALIMQALEEQGMALGHEQAIAMAQLMQQLEEQGMAISHDNAQEMARLMQDLANEGTMLDQDNAMAMAQLMHDLEEDGKVLDHDRAKKMATFMADIEKELGISSREQQEALMQLQYELEMKRQLGGDWTPENPMGMAEFNVLAEQYTQLEPGSPLRLEMYTQLMAWAEQAGFTVDIQDPNGDDEEETEEESEQTGYYGNP